MGALEVWGDQSALLLSEKAVQAGSLEPPGLGLQRGGRDRRETARPPQPPMVPQQALLLHGQLCPALS